MRKLQAKSILLLSCAFWLASAPTTAQSTSVPVSAFWDEVVEGFCEFGGTVKGLKKDGDGFLAVRKGPGTRYAMVDKIHNGQTVSICDDRGNWFGVVYTKKGTDCFGHLPRGITKPYKGRCWSGWVHKNWIRDLAG